MRHLITALGAAALALAPALALSADQPAAKGSDEKAQTTEQKSQESSGTSDPEHMKGYGYGTPSGVEANASAGQATKVKPTPSAQDDAHADSTKAGARGSGRMLHGTLAKVSGTSLSLREGQGKVARLKVTERTTVLRDGKRVPVSALRPGEEVRASFEDGKGGRIATEITVIGAPRR